MYTKIWFWNFLFIPIVLMYPQFLSSFFFFAWKIWIYWKHSSSSSIHSKQQSIQTSSHSYLHKNLVVTNNRNNKKISNKLGKITNKVIVNLTQKKEQKKNETKIKTPPIHTNLSYTWRRIFYIIKGWGWWWWKK